MAKDRNTSELEDLAAELGLDPQALEPHQIRVLTEHAERKRFLELLRSLNGNFVRARWRGVDILPKDIRR